MTYPSPACFGKTPYANKARAMDRIEKQMGNRKRTKRCTGWYAHRRLHAYQCKECHQWHVGSEDQPPKAPKRRFRLDARAVDV